MNKERFLYLLKIKCNYGTDDPFFLSLSAFAFRAIWMVYGLALCAYYFILPGCGEVQRPGILSLSILGVFVVHLLNLISLLAIIIISSLGTLRQPEPRQKIVAAFHVLLALFVAEPAWLVFSTYVATSDGIQVTVKCAAYQHALVLFYIVVGTSWPVYILFFTLFMINLDPCGCFSNSSFISHMADLARYEKENETMLDVNSSLDNIHSGKLVHRRYQKYISRSTVVSQYFGRRMGVMRDVAKVVSTAFKDLDLPLSDLVIGLYLASEYQYELRESGKCLESELTKVTRKSKSKDVESEEVMCKLNILSRHAQAMVRLLKESGHVSSDYVTPPPTPLTRQEVEELSYKCRHYFKFCEAANEMQLTRDNITASRRRLTKCYHQDLEDIASSTNATIISAITGVPKESILIVCCTNYIFRIPFFVSYCSEKKELVVCIRGMQSIQDAVANLSVTFENIPSGFLGIDEVFVHRGYYDAAVYIYKLLEDNQHFQIILVQNEVDKFVITGHSLGAAVAAVLAILFKDRHADAPWINKLEAFVFSTPGALLDYRLAEKTESFIVSVVAGNDVIPRLTLHSLAYLKSMVETLLGSVDHHKYQIQCGVRDGWFHCHIPPHLPQNEYLVGLEYNPDKPEYQVDHDNDNGCIQKLKRLLLRVAMPTCIQKLKSRVTMPTLKYSVNKMLEERFIERVNMCGRWNKDGPDHPMVFVAGRILHLEEYQTANENQVKGSWKAREHMSTIIVHQDMLKDHTLDQYLSFSDDRLAYCPDPVEEQITVDNPVQVDNIVQQGSVTLYCHEDHEETESELVEQTPNTEVEPASTEVEPANKIADKLSLEVFSASSISPEEEHGNTSFVSTSGIQIQLVDHLPNS